MRMMKSRTQNRMLTVLLTIVLCFAGTIMAWAAIPDSGIRCQGCHVTPGQAELLPLFAGNQGCIYCHSSSTSSTTYELDLGGGLGETVTVPVVYFTGASAPTSYLAGGNFWWVSDDGGNDDTKGHNIFSDDPNYDNLAPGNQNGSGCGGVNACHNNLDQEWIGAFGTRQGCTSCHMLTSFGETPIIGFHHADDTADIVVGFDTNDTDGYFRFLAGGKCVAQHAGVCGIEDDDWQATSSSTDHNEYLGNQSSLNTPANMMATPGPQGHTITGFCCGCHGTIHWSSNDPGGGDWFRHPAGVVLPDSGEFASYTTFDPDAPVARPLASATRGDFDDWTGPASSVVPGEDLVNCLSCHRAHGSPYPKMLRWDLSGCINCHTNK